MDNVKDKCQDYSFISVSVFLICNAECQKNEIRWGKVRRGPNLMTIKYKTHFVATPKPHTAIVFYKNKFRDKYSTVWIM